MRYLNFLWAIVFSITSAFAHIAPATTNHSSYFEMGKQWLYKSHDPLMPEKPSDFHTVTVCGDTVVDGITAVRMCSESLGTEPQKSYFVEMEKNGIIYRYDDSAKEFMPMIDFNIKVGDAVQGAFKVTNIADANVEGVTRRIITLQGAKEDDLCYWIEGIGATTDIYLTPIEVPIGYVTDLIECSNNGVCLYDQNNLEKYILAENRTVREGRVWNYELQHRTAEPDSPSVTPMNGYHFEGTKAVGGQEYSIFRDGENNEIGYMREEDHQVYVLLDPKSSDGQEPQEYLLYDFNLKTGDQYMSMGFDDQASHMGIPVKVEVRDVYDVVNEGITYRCQKISPIEFFPHYEYEVFEGIGMPEGLLPYPQFANFSSGLTTDIESLVNVTDENGKVIFENHGESNAVGSIAEETLHTGVTYDLFGRPVTEILPATLYIRDGKKFVAK